jgi:hypothetical protein
MVADANVLLDYAAADPGVLMLAGQHLGELHVPARLLAELPELGGGALALRPVEETLDQLIEAGTRRGRIGFTDHLCLILARASGWTCLTNDSALASACYEDGVPTVGGLDLVTALVEARHLEAQAGVAVAEALCRANPRHTTRAGVARLRERLGVAG